MRSEVDHCIHQSHACTGDTVALGVRDFGDQAVTSEQPHLSIDTRNMPFTFHRTLGILQPEPTSDHGRLKAIDEVLASHNRFEQFPVFLAQRVETAHPPSSLSLWFTEPIQLSIHGGGIIHFRQCIEVCCVGPRADLSIPRHAADTFGQRNPSTAFAATTRQSEDAATPGDG